MTFSIISNGVPFDKTEALKLLPEQANYLLHIIQKRSVTNPLSGCFEWQGSLTQAGYGQMASRILSKAAPITLHRASWIIHNGKIPKGLYICHTCDNRRCWNIEHLFCGTPTDNVRDMIAKGRQRHDVIFTGDDHWTRRMPEKVRKGHKHGGAKLKPNEVREIRSRSNEMHLTLATEFNVTRSTITAILNRRKWRELV